MKLYNYWRSSASWRVRIALAYKGIRYEYVPVDLLKDGGQQRAEGYRALNPLMQVPTLEWQEGTETRRLTQSIAILEYLEELCPDPPLLPREPYLRARARQLAEVVNSGIQPLQNLEAQRYVREELRGDASAWTRHFIVRGMMALEEEAKRSAGDFLVGDTLTFADVCLVPQMFATRRFVGGVEAFPTLARIEARCLTLPAFQQALPERQPDAPRPGACGGSP
jgi:maleylpyruvate isomerase